MTKIRTAPVVVSYPKQVKNSLKQVFPFYCVEFSTYRVPHPSGVRLKAGQVNLTCEVSVVNSHTVMKNQTRRYQTARIKFIRENQLVTSASNESRGDLTTRKCVDGDGSVTMRAKKKIDCRSSVLRLIWKSARYDSVWSIGPILSMGDHLTISLSQTDCVRPLISSTPKTSHFRNITIKKI